MAFAAVGALFAEGAAVSIGTALTAVAEIGTALSVVGAVTGSKDLMKIGGVMGLVGLGGGLINGLAGAAEGAVSEGAALSVPQEFTQSASDAFDAAGANAPPSASDFSTGGLDAGPDIASTSGATSSGDVLNAGQGSQIANGTANSATPVVNTSSPVQSAASDTTSVSAPDTANIGPKDVTGAQAPSSPADYDRLGVGLNNNGNTSLDSNTSFNADGSVKKSSNFFGNVLDFFQNDKNKNLLNMGGNLLKGISESNMFDKKVDLQQQSLDMQKQQLANGSAQPTIGMTVNPGANIFSNPQQQYAGIIARARG